ETHEPPGGADRHQGRDDKGEKRELKGGGVVGPAGHRRQGRRQGDQEHQDGDPETRGSPPSGTLVGPPRGSPGGHRVGRRWKKPQRSTTNSVPRGMAMVRAWAPTTSDARITCSGLPILR